MLAAAWMLAAQAQPAVAPPAAAVKLDGYVGVLADVLPRLDAAEFRPSLLLDLSGERGRLQFQAEAAVEALAARRGETVTDVAVRARDVWAQLAGERMDIRVGYGRIVWGRLDEIQPSDVINPIDTARFLLDGRSEARLAVGFVRGRVFAGDSVTFEGVFVPFFRRGSFDQRDEATSPFNLTKDAILPAGVTLATDEVRQQTPAAIWANISGGGRVLATIGSLDVAASVYRGFDAFGPIALEFTSAPPVSPAVIGELVESHPRFTMVAGDFETVHGKWAMRGEVALFPERRLAGIGRVGLVDAKSIDAGVGVDRRAGDFGIFASAILHREWSAEDPAIDRMNVSIVGSIERPFRRDRWLARAFGVLNPGDRSGFLRGLVLWKPRDNVTYEFSAAAFLGTGDDSIGRFKGRDFLFARLKYHF